MACFSVSQDFSYTNAAERKLFQLVEAETLADTPENETLIRDTIRYLHLRFLNEEVSEAELEIAFNPLCGIRKPVLPQVITRPIDSIQPAKRATIISEMAAIKT